MLNLTLSENTDRLSGLRQLARELEVSETIAVEIYEQEWTRLNEGAIVKAFVGILAEKRAKAAIRNRGHA